MSDNYLDQLADFVVSTRLEDLDESTVAAARNVVLDTIGAILAGSRLAENAKFAKLAQTLGAGGLASLFGHSGQVQPMFAAMVNATAGVALEMDEGTRLGGGHPSTHVTPGAFAVAEQQGKTGKGLLESIIVGYEVTSRIGTATESRSEVHSHGTWGTIGTAAATARLLGFDVAQTKTAMNLATSMSPANTWTPCLEGATIRNLYPGRSGFQGILAAHLTECGFTALQDAPSDLYSSILGDGFDPKAVVDALGQPGSYRIQQNYFKMHACCLYNHPALDAVQALLRRENFASEDVANIRIEAPPLALIMADPQPQNMLAAKFSIPYAVAAMVSKGTADVTAFYPDQLGDPDIGRLAQKVEVVADDQMSLRRYDYPASRVVVTLKDGRDLKESVTAQRGDAKNPVSSEELVGKFSFLASETLGEQGTQRVIDTVSRLETLDKVSDLTELLRK
ncbi:MAG: MmgE/PrpD family protein [Chloroflexi bacterium]|nr:MmgE/PrpD family protein [Chloroflexota bacterium]